MAGNPQSRTARTLCWLWTADPADGIGAAVRDSPATLFVIGVVVAMWFASEVLPGAMSVRHALGMSGFDVARGQWWRLFTPTLLNTPDNSGHIHTSALAHLLLNLSGLVLLGPRVERILGRARYLALWVVAEVLGRAWLGHLFPLYRGYEGGTSIFAVGALQAVALLDAALHRRHSTHERRYLAALTLIVAVEVLTASGTGQGNTNAHAAGAIAGIVLVAGMTLHRRVGSVAALAVTAAVGLSLAGVQTADVRRTSPQLQTTIKVGRSPYYVAAGAGSLWVSNYGDATVYRIDPHTNRVVATIGLGGKFASGIAVGDGLVWVVNSPRSVVAIDPHLNRVIRRVVVPADASGVAFGSGSVWISCVGANVVVRIDPVDGHVVTRIRVGKQPFEVAADESSVWVANYKAATLSRIDPATNRITRSVHVNRYVDGVAIGTDAVWAAANVTARIALDGSRVTKSPSPDSDLFLIASDGTHAWGTRDNTVVRFDDNARVVRRIHLGVARSSGVAVADGSVWVTDVAGGHLFRVAK